MSQSDGWLVTINTLLAIQLLSAYLTIPNVAEK